MFYHLYGFALLSNCVLPKSHFTPGDRYPLCHHNNVHIPVQRHIVTRSGIPARPAKMTGQQPGTNKPYRIAGVAQCPVELAHSNCCRPPALIPRPDSLRLVPATRSAKHCGFLLRHPGTGKGSRWFIKWCNGRHAARPPVPVPKISSLCIANLCYRHARP